MAITIQTLFSNFKETREWNKLSHNSKMTYQQMMNRAENDYFLIMNRTSQITEDYVDKLYARLLKTKSVSHATMFMKVMRRVWSVSKRKKWVDNNPFREMGLQTPAARTIRWTNEQYTKYLEVATEKRYYDIIVVVTLCYELGQRPGDMKQLTAKNFNADYSEVKFVQQKTKKAMHLPIISESLRRAVKGFLPFITKHSEREFNNLHHEVLDVAGLPPNLQIRDLRRTAILETMEAGASDAEGQAISGHTNRQELNTYAPSSIAMARHAMEKRFSLK